MRGLIVETKSTSGPSARNFRDEIVETSDNGADYEESTSQFEA